MSVPARLLIGLYIHGQLAKNNPGAWRKLLYNLPDEILDMYVVGKGTRHQNPRDSDIGGQALVAQPELILHKTPYAVERGLKGCSQFVPGHVKVRSQ
jgi:hypothetical protein